MVGQRGGGLTETPWLPRQGEKYEKLRRLGPQPFSCAFRQHRSKPKPLVYVDVKVLEVQDVTKMLFSWRFFLFHF